MPKQLILRLDDACEKRDLAKWDRMEAILDKYQIKPIVGVIPHCLDPDFVHYPTDENFWKRVAAWKDKGWIIAMHGYSHVFTTKCGGVNPVNAYSEFAGVAPEEQRRMITEGIKIFHSYGIEPEVFFAPAHTFDENTVTALLECSQIRTISDTVAYDFYRGKDGMTYIPQQSGRVRNLPFRAVTFCYHPNAMNEKDEEELVAFLAANQTHFYDVRLTGTHRNYKLIDWFLKTLYFIKR